MRFVFIKGSFAICTAGVVFWIVLLVTKSRSSPLQVLGSPSLIQLLRICLCRASISSGCAVLPPGPLSLSSPSVCCPFPHTLAHWAFPGLSLPEPLPGLSLAQCAGASCATAAFWVTCISEQMGVCCLMVQRLKPTWFPFLSYSVSLHLEKDAFFPVIFPNFYFKVCFPCRLYLLLSYPNISYKFDTAGCFLNHVESLMHLILGWNKNHKGKQTALKLL